jgi:hypothetical protein
MAVLAYFDCSRRRRFRHSRKEPGDRQNRGQHTLRVCGSCQNTSGKHIWSESWTDIPKLTPIASASQTCAQLTCRFNGIEVVGAKGFEPSTSWSRTSGQNHISRCPGVTYWFSGRSLMDKSGQVTAAFSREPWRINSKSVRCVKALGTGWTDEFDWKEIEVMALASGAPDVRLSGNVLALAQSIPTGKIHLSISQTTHVALAQAVIERGA